MNTDDNKYLLKRICSADVYLLFSTRNRLKKTIFFKLPGPNLNGYIYICSHISYQLQMLHKLLQQVICIQLCTEIYDLISTCYTSGLMLIKLMMLRIIKMCKVIVILCVYLVINNYELVSYFILLFVMLLVFSSFILNFPIVLNS